MEQGVQSAGARLAGRTLRVCLLTVLVFCFLTLINLNAAPLEAAWVELARLIDLKSEPLSASPARLSDHVVAELDAKPPQKQAEVLVQRAANQYQGALEQIALRVGGWRGHINLTPEFTGMLTVAQNSNDLRVRAAAIEVYLAAYDLAKDSGSYYQLVRRAREEAGARPWALWMLGALGNRGVEPQGAFDTLREFARDRDEETRYWAVAGLGLLGSDETIATLLEVFHNDPSPRVREHAACNLAQSGMLTHAQRMRAVPELLNFMDDPSLDPETQGWVYQALRDITGEWFGRSPAAWRTWWDARARR
jgi:hypothetical protein